MKNHYANRHPLSPVLFTVHVTPPSHWSHYIFVIYILIRTPECSYGSLSRLGRHLSPRPHRVSLQEAILKFLHGYHIISHGVCPVRWSPRAVEFQRLQRKCPLTCRRYHEGNARQLAPFRFSFHQSHSCNWLATVSCKLKMEDAPVTSFAPPPQPPRWVCNRGMALHNGQNVHTIPSTRVFRVTACLENSSAISKHFVEHSRHFSYISRGVISQSLSQPCMQILEFSYSTLIYPG